jgi:hypothetical protein
MTTPVERVAAILSASLARQLARPAPEAARMAYRAGGPSLAELEQRITALRQH